MRRCIDEGLVGGDGFAVDASLIRAEANRQAYVEGPQGLPADLPRRAIERAADRLGLWTRKLIGDTGYGSAGMLAWLVHERGIKPHVPIFDKSARSDGAFEHSDFTFDH